VEDLVIDELDECLTQWRIGKDVSLRLGSRIVVLNDAALRKEILQESHRSRFTIHPGGTKMYRDMKHTFWWEGMKRD
ncbi:integrase zinc binding domain-containing protein, partial [Pseudomonas syringae]|uniref:integrase zinc binding domain-containing protein n=1 Tax=Pseudomonas syringae TaxID=317 RepID=UPI0034D9875E